MSIVSATSSGRRRNSSLAFLQTQEATLAVFIVVLLVFLGITAPAFMEMQNLQDVLVNASLPAIAAIGMTMVIVSKEIDISIGSILAVCAILSGNLAVLGVPVPLVILITLVVGGLMGALNGFLIAVTKIPSIIVTLGMLSFWRGLVIVVTKGEWVYNMPAAFQFAQRDILGLAVPIWLMIILVSVAAIWMRYYPVGRQIYAVGGNQQAAMLAGVPVGRMLFLAFTMNGIFAAMAALITASRFSVVQTNVGIGFEFQVITAVVIGGTSIMGGVGTVIGSLLGAVLLSTIATGMTFLKVSPYWLQSVQGSLILLSVLADVLRRRRARG